MEVKVSKTSLDGQHVASVVSEGGKEFIVLDGKPKKKYDLWIERDSLTFSPDSRRLAYVVRHHGGEFVVLDEREQRKYGWVDSHTLVFSPDSRRFAYVVWKESFLTGRNKYCVVVDGRKGRSYDLIKPPVFTPDSRFLAYIAGTQGPIRPTLIGDARLLEHFYLVIIQLKTGMYRLLALGRSEKRFAIDGVGWLFPEVSADSKLVMAVDRNNGERRLTVNVDDEFGKT